MSSNKGPTCTCCESNYDSDPVMSFSCGCGKRRITHSLNQTIVKGDLNPGGAIGWNGKAGAEMFIEGVEVPCPQSHEIYTKCMKASDMTTAKKKKIHNLVGKVNDSTFKGWSKGEVMFVGADYTAKQGAEYITISYYFDVCTNSSVNIGGETVDKKGFEHVWAITDVQVATDNKVEVVAKGIYKDQVLEYGDFGDLGL
jgi:hypothetical protein